MTKADSTQKTVMVDGQVLSEEAAVALFKYFTPADRQLKALALLEREPFKNLLDIGCYSGQFLNEVIKKRPEAKCIGVDSYEDNIRIAKLLHPERADDFLKMSAYSLDFPDASFDVITMLEVIEHLDRPVDALREINRALRPSGILVISTPNACSASNVFSSIVTGYRNFINRILSRPQKISDMIFFENVPWNRHVQEYHPAALATVLKVNGFEIIKHSFVASGTKRKLLGTLCPGLSGGQLALARKCLPPNNDLV
ncbi:MAG: hypothetical protein A2X49_17000 [Lentisphaerae bacterium GWF2_52_8]|nr:MAG: hypothetical protein A2X49_17000 [Lentisphaerae bacterium GWF2_52_8]